MSNVAHRIGVISLEQRIEDPAETKFEDLYQAIGLNTGNFMFTNAVFRQIGGNLTQIGFFFDPKKINNEFDALVVPAANWINDITDWTWLVNLLEKIEVPIITIGIGLQADSKELSKVRVSESSMRLVKLLSNKSKWISCRGDFTRDWLVSIGITNVVTTGCPSIYIGFHDTKCKYDDCDTVVLQGTRYWVSGEFIRSNNANRQMYYLAGRLDLPIIYQSEAEEIDHLVYSVNGDDEHAKTRMSDLAKLYGFASDADMRNYLSRKGRLFFDIDQWSGYIKRNIGVIGTRLHGAIVALNSGKPACLITHDSRTQEVADFARIPQLTKSNYSEMSKDGIVKILEDTDLSFYYENRKSNAATYQQFLEACDLQPNYAGIVTDYRP